MRRCCPHRATPVIPALQLTLRRAIAQALDRADLSDTLPPVARERYALPLFELAIRALHTPAQGESEQALLERVHPAWRRISSTSCWRSTVVGRRPPRGASRKPRRCRPATRRTGWWPGCTKPCRR